MDVSTQLAPETSPPARAIDVSIRNEIIEPCLSTSTLASREMESLLVVSLEKCFSISFFLVYRTLEEGFLELQGF